MRLIEETRERWRATLDSYESIASLTLAVKDTAGKSPCTIGLRSICWKIFLLFQHLDTSKWPKTLADSRSAYTSLREHHTRNLMNSEDLSADDPLSESETSPWNVLRQDEELRAEILQDVERCMPENGFFREPPTQGMLLEILFVYCKLNRDISYRQGMHEVLAPILWVVYCDAIGARDQEAAAGDELICTSLDPTYIEHDAFTLFGAVMQSVKTFYEMGNNSDPTTTGMLNNSPIVERSKRIHENYLQHADPELAEHLTAIEILPQIFLIRWVRLIFGREFPFEDVLGLWDTLFADDPGLELVDLISVSMLLRIRWQLLEADYTGALTLLLRYPVPQAPHGPQSFVGDALYLRENLLLDGGDHIISKYSRRSPETTVTRKLPKKVKKARTLEQKAAQNATFHSAPIMSPSRYLQEQGGIEGIIQEAARGVYSRSEKWGVAKALRGAVQGLQSANASPHNQGRWSLDSGKVVAEAPASDLVARIEALEDRNRALSKMLAASMNELWSQQKDVELDDGMLKGSDALSLAIAKVQLVQVYLENTNMPLPADLLDNLDERKDTKPGGSPVLSQDGGPKSPPLIAVDSLLDEKTLPTKTKPKGGRSPKKTAKAARTDVEPTTPPKKLHTSRPSLSQSPYSWMLGEEQQKSGFVATSPFSSPGSRPGRERTGSLFGGDEEKQDGPDARDVFVGQRKR